MLRRSPRAALLWLGAALVTIVTSLGVATELVSIHRRARALGPAHPILFTTRDLPVGATVTRDAVLVRRVHDGAPPGAVRDPSAAVGRVVTIPLLRGEVVGARHLAPAERHGLDGVVPRGRRAVRLAIDDGLRPKRGQRVDVLATFDPATVPAGRDPTTLVAPAVLVVAVDAAGTLSDTGPSGGHTGVTVLVSPEESRRLAFATANGVLTLALTPPEEAPDS